MEDGSGIALITIQQRGGGYAYALWNVYASASPVGNPISTSTVIIERYNRYRRGWANNEPITPFSLPSTKRIYEISIDSRAAKIGRIACVYDVFLLMQSRKIRTSVFGDA